MQVFLREASEVWSREEPKMVFLISETTCESWECVREQ
jgi:hypothetical protein